MRKNKYNIGDRVFKVDQLLVCMLEPHWRYSNSLIPKSVKGDLFKITKIENLGGLMRISATNLRNDERIQYQLNSEVDNKWLSSDKNLIREIRLKGLLDG